MRFELVQVLGHTQNLEQVRPAGTEAEARAADYMVEHLHRAGLHVERQDITASLFAERVAGRVGWLGIAVLMTAQAAALALGAGALPGVVIEALAVLIWFVEVWRPVHAWRGWPPRVRSQNVLADRLVEPGPGSRIVFLVQLDTLPQRWPLQLRLMLAVSVLMLIIMIGDANLGLTGRIGGRAVMPLVILLWLVALVLAAEPIDRFRPQARGDGRMSLALLLELARTMSRRTFERVEVRFVALGAQSLGEAGLRALTAQMSREWADKPTLFLLLDSPSYREGLGLGGHGPGLALGAAAARDLWIPFRVLPAALFPPDPPGRLLRGAGASYVTLVGDPAPRFSMRRSSPLPRDHAEAAPSLPSIIQIATELALRWARRFEPQAQELESRARSSQKPG